MRPLVIVLLLAPSLGLACEPSPKAAISSATPQQCSLLIKQITSIPAKASWDSCNLETQQRDWKRSPEYLAWTKEVKNHQKGSRISLPPPPPPPLVGSALGPMDPAHCKLLDPTAVGVDDCLANAMLDATQIKNPMCPSMPAYISVGDLAFFILADRHPGLWEQVVPAQSDGYYKQMHQPNSRIRLQRRVKSLLMPNNSFKPKPLRGSA